MKKGFTLLELIIVIIIIGILASFALPMYIRAAERARSGEGASLLGIVRGAQLRYYAQHSEFTDSLGKLDVDITTPKYFTVTPQGGNNSSEEVPIATAERKSFQQPSGYNYTLSITVSGNITCTPTDICGNLGY